MPVPQPSTDRMVPFAGHPAVVGITPEEPDLVALTAAALASAAAMPVLHFGYVDASRYLVEELPDGDVRHASLNPDSPDDSWRETDAIIRDRLGRLLAPGGISWRFHYLAGRPDRALTHLARAVDAAVIVVGTRAPGTSAKLREAVEGSVAMHLSHHQHRPVLTVPLDVVDWKATTSSWD